jgi:hypothetical protein
MDKKTRNFILNLCGIGVLGLFLYWAQGNLDGYKIQVLNLVAVNAILALSLNLIYGFTGMFSLGHAGFMAIGAYVCAILILSPAQKQALWILEPIIWPFSVIGAPFVVAVFIGGLIASFFGLLIAIPVLRLGGDYLGIATLGFAEIIRVVLTNLTPITNGALGIKGIPSYANIWWNYGWLLFTLYFMVKFLNSNFGNVLKAIRDDEIAAKNMGIDTFRYRVNFVNNAKMMPPLDKLIFSHSHIISKIVEAKLTVRSVSYVRKIRFFSFFLIHISINTLYGEAEKTIDRSHPFCVTLRQVVIHCNHMYSIAGKGIKHYRKGGHKCLPFTSLHFCYLAFVKSHASH